MGEDGDDKDDDCSFTENAGVPRVLPADMSAHLDMRSLKPKSIKNNSAWACAA